MKFRKVTPLYLYCYSLSYAPFNLHLLDHSINMDTQRLCYLLYVPSRPIVLSLVHRSKYVDIRLVKSSEVSRTFSHPSTPTPLHTSIWDLVQLNLKFYDYEDSYWILAPHNNRSPNTLRPDFTDIIPCEKRSQQIKDQES